MTHDPGGAAQAVARFFTPMPDGRVGVAVSGGSDSLALLHLMHDHLGPDRMHAVTVDHGLRDGSAQEAATVADIAAQLGIPHTTLRWSGWDGQGNLPDRARRARYTLMADWASAAGIDQIALGHTADDQAETFVMRLARGAGADGLAAMATHRVQHGVTFVRPLLAIRRAALRDLLTARGQRWIDDPTNDDTTYDRPRIRRALPDLAALGLTVEALTTSAGHLASTRDALTHYAVQEAQAHVRIDGPDVVIAPAAVRDIPADITRRILLASLRWIAATGYPPRRTALDRMIDALRGQERTTLAGCLATSTARGIRLSREPGAVTGLVCPPDAIWDGRWRIDGPFQPGDQIGAAGEAGLALCPDWRDTGLPRTTLLASPAVWRNGAPIAVPLAGDAAKFGVRLLRTVEDFHATLRAH